MFRSLVFCRIFQSRWHSFSRKIPVPSVTVLLVFCYFISFATLTAVKSCLVDGIEVKKRLAFFLKYIITFTILVFIIFYIHNLYRGSQFFKNHSDRSPVLMVLMAQSKKFFFQILNIYT
jgi:hypothetical protein